MSVFGDRRGGTDAELRQADPWLSERCGQEESYRIAYSRWTPETVRGRTVLYNHGLQSHRGWFAATAAELSERGHPVYAFDRIGSGESGPGLSQHWGEAVSARGHIRQWRLFLDSVERMVEVARRDHPDNEIVLWGNSYGGKVVTAFLWDRAEELAEMGVTGAILTVPGNFRASSMPLPFSILWLLLAHSSERFPVPMVERDGDNGAHWFVSPGRWFDAIASDELSMREVTRSFYLQTSHLDRFNQGQSESSRFPVPLLALMVQGDRMMDNAKMESYLKRHASAETSWKFYRGGPEAKHFLLFTADRSAALTEVEAFLQRS